MLTPVMSLGSRSGVNWMRRTELSMDRASALASMVLPTPGTSSTSRWPSANSTVSAVVTTFSLPSITDCIARRMSSVVRVRSSRTAGSSPAVVTRAPLLRAVRGLPLLSLG
jgi:hypothetical protein